MPVMSMPSGPATVGEVFSLIRDGRVLTRSDVGRLTGLSRTAVAARLATLLDSGLVVEGADVREERAAPGRPASHLRFNRDAGVVLAGAIGRSRTQLGVCDLDGADLYRRADDEPETVRARLAKQLAPLAEVVGHYRGHGVLRSVDGRQPIAAVTEQVLAAL